MKRDASVRIYLKIVSIALVVMLTAGIFLHWKLRDSWPLLGPLYYGLPLPVISAGWGVLLLLNLRKKAIAILSLIAGAACLWWWVSGTCQSRVLAVDAKTTPRVLFWNMAHHLLPSTALSDLIQHYQPDLVGMVEAGHRHSDPNPLVAQLPAGYMELKLPNSIALIVRGQAKMLRNIILPDDTKIVEVETQIDGQTFKVIIADVTAKPTSPRGQPLSSVLNWAGNGPNTIVMGDFNTPVESTFFDQWHKQFHHAFNEAGSGLRETWPRWIPVLTIDHIWSSADLKPVRTEKIWRSASDHAALLVDLKK